MKFSKSTVRRMAIILLLAAGMLLSLSDMIPKAFQYAGLRKLNQTNDAYLEASFKNTLESFAILSTVKVGLALLEGTEVGVGFNIQVGNTVQAAYDYVDIAWKTVIFSGAVLLGTRYLIQAIGLVDQWLLALMFFLLLLHVIIRWIGIKHVLLKRMVRDLAMISMVLSAAFYLLLPLSIAGGRQLSRHITAPSLQTAQDGFQEIKEDLFPGDSTSGGMISKMKQTTNRIHKAGTYLAENLEAMSIWVFKLITGYLFDTLIFPLTLFLLLFWLVRLTAKYLFAIRKEQNFREDLEEVLRRILLRDKIKSL